MIMVTMVLSMSVTNVSAASSNKITLKNYNTPTTVEKGHGFGIKGKITAKKKIYKVEIGIVDKKTGKWKYKYTKKDINKKSFSIKKADSKLKFGKLAAGNYYYRINVQLKGKKNKRVLNRLFSVVDNTAETVSLSSADAVGVTLSGVKAPGTFKVGKEFTAKGIVTSKSKIKKVEVGIVFKATNKWTEYKYTKKVKSNSFDLAEAAEKLKFNMLPGGTYMYRMYLHTEDGLRVAFNKEFTVIPSDKPRKAVNWAIKIANDDSFTYGQKPIANTQGCYFCGNNDKKVKKAKKKKMEDPERYEKTYVCMTFIGAAYAHGAGDPEILKKCQKRYMTIYETNDNFKKFTCWMKIGACKDLTVDDLQPGDVIVQWSDHNDNNGHVCMYIGNGDIVEASGGGWGPNSIAVKKGEAARRLAKLSKNRKNYVMRYRY